MFRVVGTIDVHDREIMLEAMSFGTDVVYQLHGTTDLRDLSGVFDCTPEEFREAMHLIERRNAAKKAFPFLHLQGVA